MRDAIIKHFHTRPELRDDMRADEGFHRTHSLTYDLLMYFHKSILESDPLLLAGHWKHPSYNYRVFIRN
jgi:hypothetical protein